MKKSRLQKYVLVEEQPLSFSERAVFVFRLLLLVLTHPVAAYAYIRAMRIEGYYNPKEFTQALVLRLGSGATGFDPLRPRPVAKKILKLGNEVPFNDHDDVGVMDGSMSDH